MRITFATLAVFAGALISTGCTSADDEYEKAEVIAETVRISALAADDTHLYWIDHGNGNLEARTYDGRLYRLPLSGGSPELLVEGLDWPVDLAIDTTHVYWINSGGISIRPQRPGTLQRLPKSGGAAELLAEDLEQPDSIAVDDEHVYVCENEGGRIFRVPKEADSALELLVADREGPADLRLAAGTLLWHEQYTAGGTYYRQLYVTDGLMAPRALGPAFEESVTELGWLDGKVYVQLDRLNSSHREGWLITLDPTSDQVDELSSGVVERVGSDGQNLVWVEDAKLLEGATLVEYDPAQRSAQESRIGDSAVGPLWVHSTTLFWHIGGRVYARRR